jgi:tight adherence protein B
MVPLLILGGGKMDFSTNAFYILLFLAFFASLLSISLLISYAIRRQQTGKRIRVIDDNIEGVEDDRESSEIWRQVAAMVGKPFQSEKIQDQIGLLIRQSNLPLRKEEFLGFCLLLSVGLFMLGWFILGSILTGLFLAITGFYIPIIWAKSRVKKRSRALQDQLVDMLTMTSNSLKAGYSFLQALELISREMPAPMSEEFQRLIKETQLGVTTEDALQNLGKRMNNEDFDLIITAVLIQRQIGGNLAHILDSISKTIRERVRIHREIKALTAQGRMSGYIFRLLPIGIGLFVYVANPSYMINLFNEPLGWFLLGFAVVGQVIGSILINKIIQIEV